VTMEPEYASAVFFDRADAGRQLAEHLAQYADDADVVVLGLPRGGIPVAYEVARALHAPLDVYVVRKLGVPGYPELAMGAIASGGVRVLNEDVVANLGIPDHLIDAVAAEEEAELWRREQAYREGRPPLDVRGKKAILIDGGLATGATVRAAVEALRQRGPAKIIVAVPVGAAETCAEFEQIADEATCARTPEPFLAVGYWYGDFSQTTNEEVREQLAQAAKENTPARPV